MTTRRDLIAQRAVALARPSVTPTTKRRRRTVRCSTCGGLGHNSKGCHGRPVAKDLGATTATTTASAPGAMSFEDVEDLEVGHDVALRGDVL